MDRKKALKILGFNPSDNPSKQEIKRAYRKLALKYHSDKHPSASKGVEKQSGEKFRQIGAAYKLLTRKSIEKAMVLHNKGLGTVDSIEDIRLCLYAALLRQDIAFLKKLFSKFKSSGNEEFGDYINNNTYPHTALVLAIIEGGNIEIVKLLLEHSADCNMKDNYGSTALHEACRRGYNKIVKLLLKCGANPNIQDDQGKAPLHYLCGGHFNKGSVEIAKLLLKEGADLYLEGQDGKRPVDCVTETRSSAREMFVAVNYEKAASLGIAMLLATAGSVTLASGVADHIIGKVWCSSLAVGMAACALCCARHTIRTLFFPAGPSTEFTEARAEFLNIRQWQSAGVY